MKAVGYHKSLPVAENDSLTGFTTDKPVPTRGRTIGKVVLAGW